MEGIKQAVAHPEGWWIYDLRIDSDKCLLNGDNSYFIYKMKVPNIFFKFLSL